MIANGRFHDQRYEWDVVYHILEKIHAVRGLLCINEFDKILQRLEILEREIDILSILIGKNMT